MKKLKNSVIRYNGSDIDVQGWKSMFQAIRQRQTSTDWRKYRCFSATPVFRKHEFVQYFPYVRVIVPGDHKPYNARAVARRQWAVLTVRGIACVRPTRVRRRKRWMGRAFSCRLIITKLIVTRARPRIDRKPFVTARRFRSICSPRTDDGRRVRLTTSFYILSLLL